VGAGRVPSTSRSFSSPLLLLSPIYGRREERRRLPSAQENSVDAREGRPLAPHRIRGRKRGSHS
jgi:hypothetical protein